MDARCGESVMDAAVIERDRGEYVAAFPSDGDRLPK
jgi:hypothetical protein